MGNWLGLAAALMLPACGSTSDVEVDPAVAPFVGRWDAVVMTATADAPPNEEVDVLTLGAFWISVEPSGTYTATLEYPGALPEIGQLTVESPTVLTLHPTGAPPAPSNYFFATPDSLILDGATEYDFNGDRTDEPAQVHLVLVRE